VGRTPAETVSRCEQCGTENPPQARFCMECGVRLTSDDKETGGGERRTVTVVFADLSGFTNFSEQSDPEEVRALAQGAAVRLEAIVRRHGGSVDKVIGDCVMALFGAPVTHEDDAARAVRASLEMLADVLSDSDAYAGLALRVGVNTGEVIFASVGPSGQYTALGDTVNTASRLQSAAVLNGIYVGARTYEATAQLFEYVEVPPVTAKGKAEAVPAWRPTRVAGLLVEPARRSLLVGRERELGRLEELLDRVVGGGGSETVTVVGAPGIG
jgi:class 3 adenylate cyclase